MTPTRTILMGLLLGAGVALAPIALADSGQLRDPTRCGSGPANCRNLPPSASDRIKSAPRGIEREERGTRPSLRKTSPLPSEFLKPVKPGSTGLDKGSTGLGKDPPK
nr:hypothetical protein [uncultured Dongia sp.]